MGDEAGNPLGSSVGVPAMPVGCHFLSYLIGYLLIMRDNIQFARMLRARSTDAEMALWRRLRRRQISDTKFRRQEALGPYIVDFISFNPRIVIELDGGQHATPPQQESDVRRDRWLEEQGFLVIRFWNTDVLLNMDGVLEKILDTVRQCSTR